MMKQALHKTLPKVQRPWWQAPGFNYECSTATGGVQSRRKEALWTENYSVDIRGQSMLVKVIRIPAEDGSGLSRISRTGDGWDEEPTRCVCLSVCCLCQWS